MPRLLLIMIPSFIANSRVPVESKHVIPLNERRLDLPIWIEFGCSLSKLSVIPLNERRLDLPIWIEFGCSLSKLSPFSPPSTSPSQTLALHHLLSAWAIRLPPSTVTFESLVPSLPPVPWWSQKKSWYKREVRGGVQVEGTHVHPWLFHVNVWQKHHSIVKQLSYNLNKQINF